jgi:ribosomal-protein-alanine N-acetyltransferase
MQPADLEQVLTIDRISFSLPWPESAYKYELTANPSSRSWVAEVEKGPEERQVVGMIVAWLILDAVHIATIAVDPDYRSQGIGRQLLVTALVDAIGRGAREAMLEVRAGNQVAQSLYLRLGFEIVNRRPRYYRDNNEDALLMNLTGIGEAYLAWLESGAQGQWKNVSDQ